MPQAQLVATWQTADQTRTGTPPANDRDSIFYVVQLDSWNRAGRAELEQKEP